MFSKSTHHLDVDVKSHDPENPVELILQEINLNSNILPLKTVNDEIFDLDDKLKFQSDSFRNLSTIQKANSITTQNLKLYQIVQKTLEFCNEIIPFNSGNILIKQKRKWKAIQRKTKENFENIFNNLSKGAFIDWMFDKRSYIIVPIKELKLDQPSMNSGRILCFPMIVESERKGICIFYLDNDYLNFSLADLEAIKIIVNQAVISIKFLENRKQLLKNENVIKNLEKWFVAFTKMAIVGELAKGITHEINNPLQVILGKIQMAMVGTNNKDVFKAVEKQSLQIALLVRLIADISKGQKRNSTDIIELNSFIRSTISLIQKQIEKRGIKVNYGFEDKDIRILCNSNYMQQFILNSVLNVKKRMQASGELFITTRKSDNEMIQIEFKDNAPKPDVFFENDIFNYLNKSQSNDSSDLVLGEVINFFLIREMGGEIQFTNKKDSGNTVSVKLPKKR